MGGAIVFRTAASLPERVGASCSFHGGRLTTTDADSTHLLIPKMKTSMLVAIADVARRPNTSERAVER